MAELWWLWRIHLTIAVALMFMVHGVPAHPARGEKVLAKKVSQLMEWTQKNRVIRMSGTVFNHFVLETPRNYSVIVMFNTLQEFRSCVMCKHAAKEFQILANSWQHPSAFTNKVFFAMADYDQSSEVFRMLQVKSVPSFLHFSAKRKSILDDVYHFNKRGIIAEQMAEWVAERTNVDIRIRQPTNYHLFKMEIPLALTGGLMYLLKWNSKFIFSKILWAVLTVCFVIVMTSGQMWPHIKGAPYVERNPYTGHIYYMSKTSYSQLAAETYLISLFNMCITLGTVLIDKAATCRMNIVKRKMVCVSGVCLVIISFSWLLSLLRFKEPDYPHSLPMG